MKHTLITLHAQTSIHAGVGAVDSVIDLPIQREAHTGYPCIFGSSMKGALRYKSESTQDKKDTELLFGKAGDNTGGNAGSLLISDARILLLPVRSLTGTFRWVTCHDVLSRFKQDMERFKGKENFAVPEVDREKTVLCAADAGETAPDTIYLEEYRLEKSDEAVDDNLVKILAKTINYDHAENMLRQRLTIINDDDFAYLAKYTLPVNAHIALKSGTKTVQDGMLWYEETLPSDTVLYFGVAAAESRQFKEEDGKRVRIEKNDAEILRTFTELFANDRWLQIGGNETVGMGWCSVNFLSQEEC